jgi:hypothetical protein
VKRLLVRGLCKWKDNIKIDFKKMVCEDVKWLRTGSSGKVL